jgi:hypothetical protein
MTTMRAGLTSAIAIMRQLAALVAVLAIISNHAWAFDQSPETIGQIYFSIPFGAAPRQEATPHLGFRVAYGDRLTFPDRDEPGTYRDLDMRWNLDGQTVLLINGVDVAEFYPSLYAAEDEGLTGQQVALGVAIVVVAVGGAILIASGGSNDSDSCFLEDCSKK